MKKIHIIGITIAAGLALSAGVYTSLPSLFADSKHEERAVVTEESAFLPSLPESRFDTLTLEDLPSDNTMSQDIAVYDDSFFVHNAGASSHVLQYDLKGNLIAYSNDEIINCNPSQLAISDDTLYIGCTKGGLYEVDLATNTILHTYTAANGLPSESNLRLALDGDTLWVGTYDGLAKIDRATRNVTTYTNKELSGCHGSLDVHAREGEVWVVTRANAECDGGATRYDATSDTWTHYSAQAFQHGAGSRVDFRDFAVTDEGTYAMYYLGQDPDRTALARYNPAIEAWDQLVVAHVSDTTAFTALPDTQERQQSYLNSATATWNIYSATTSSWNTVPAVRREYFAMSAPTNNTYYLFSTAGLERYRRGDAFPEIIFSLPTHSAPDMANRFIVAEDGTSVVAMIRPSSDMFGVTGTVLITYSEQEGGYATILDSAQHAALGTVADEADLQLVQDGGTFFITNAGERRLKFSPETHSMEIIEPVVSAS